MSGREWGMVEKIGEGTGERGDNGRLRFSSVNNKYVFIQFPSIQENEEPITVR